MKSKSVFRSFLTIAGSSLLAISFASAQSTWTNVTGGTQQWNTAANWDTNPTIPNGTGVTANLSVNLGANQTVNLATAVTLGSLTYGDSTTAFFTQPMTGSAITFNNGGSSATLIQASVAANPFAPGLIANNLVLNDNLTIVNNGTSFGANFAMNLSGGISGTGGLILNAGGGGFVTLSNTSAAYTYSGGVTINHSSTGLVVSQQGEAFGTGLITFNAAGSIHTGSNGGGTYPVTTSNANVWNSGWNLTGTWNNNGNVTLGANASVSRSNDQGLGLGGNIGETGGARSLTFTAGNAGTTTVLNGTNTYTGGTTVSAASLSFLKTASMPSTGAVSFANGTSLGISIGGDGWASSGSGAGTLAGIFQGTNVGVGSGSSTLSYGNNVGLNLFVTGSHSFGVIENLRDGSAGAFTKSGQGTLTITGDSTYTGTTTVQGGGGLILDYDSSDTSKFASAAALTLGGINRNIGSLGGGAITLKGGSFTEVVSGTSLNAGHMSILRDGGAAKLQMNAITRTPVGTISFSDATIATTDRTNTNAILGGYATIGNDWAVNSTNAADGAIQALATYDGAMPDTTGDATKNYTLGGNVALTAATAANTVKITDTGAGESLTLGAHNLTITSVAAVANHTQAGGIMYAGGVDGNYTIAGGGTGRIASSVANLELIFAVQTGTLTVNALIGGNSPITKSGAGTLVLGGANTTNGAINVNQGVLRLNNAAASGAASGFGLLNNFVQSGAALELTGGFSFTAGERFMISGTGISNGGALRSISGANTWPSIIEIGLGGARINNDSAGLLTLSQGITTGIGGDVTIGGTGNTTVNTPTLHTLSRQAIDGGGGLIKDGAGTLTLNGKSNYAGNTTVNAGTLSLPDNSSLKFYLGHASGVNNSISGAGTVNLNGDFLIDTSAADSLSSGSWTLENVSSLSGPYGGTFTVVGFSDIGLEQWQKVVGGKTYTFDENTGVLTLTSGGGPGPLDNFLISAISSPQTVGTPITGITLTARDASNATVTSFTGTVNFGGTGGFTGTSSTFTAGVLSGVSVTPANAGSGLTFTVTDGVSGKTGTATFNIQTQYQAWAGGALFDADANNDGVKNGLAFLLGASSPTGAVTPPTVSHSAGDLVISFNMLNAASRGSASIKVQQSNDLGISDAWVDSATVPNVAGVSPAVNGVSFNVTLGSPTNGVVATVAASEALPGTKLFGRLKAEQ